MVDSLSVLGLFGGRREFVRTLLPPIQSPLCTCPVRITSFFRVSIGQTRTSRNMDVSAIQMPNPSMTLEEHIEFIFTLQQEHLAQHVQSRLDVRTGWIQISLVMGRKKSI